VSSGFALINEFLTRRRRSPAALFQLSGSGYIMGFCIMSTACFRGSSFLHIYCAATVGLAAVLVFYNVQPGTAAQLKN